eukprot:scaffold14440_cov143-Isochrysis_galbana.AAC.1
MLAILARQVTRIRAKSLSPSRPFNRAWFSPLSMRCSRPCTRARRRFVSSRFIHFVYNLRFDRGRWTIARGPSHTPFGGVRSLANTYRRCGANWAPPYNSYILPHCRPHNGCRCRSLQATSCAPERGIG